MRRRRRRPRRSRVCPPRPLHRSATGAARRRCRADRASGCRTRCRHGCRRLASRLPHSWRSDRGESRIRTREVPTPAERQAPLVARRNMKMSESAHAYVRGNTSKFYEWLDDIENHKIPEGPAIWICGDCHTGNLGPVADANGRVEIQIRDLDQTVIGNPAHDIIRLGLSLASAARGSDLPGVTTAKMMEQLIEGYEKAFGEAEDDKIEKEPEAVAWH